MSVTRPVNSAGVETIQMPELSSLPDTSPVQLAIWMNRCFNSLAHLHNNGTQTAPTYIDEGGMWARPQSAGTQALVRQGGIDRELWYTDPNGLCLPFGYTKAMGDASNLNILINEGMFHFTATTTNIPTGFTGGTVWVQRSRRSATQTVHNQLIISDSSVMCYRTGTSTGVVASLSWGDWRYLQYETAVPTVIPGAIIAFDGSFGGQSNRHPINAMTGKVDTSYALCDGATHTTEDGRTVTTPNLTDKFIKGSTPANAKQTGGGSITATVGNTTLTADQMPWHSHLQNVANSYMAAGSGASNSTGYTTATYASALGSYSSWTFGPIRGVSPSVAVSVGAVADLYTVGNGGSNSHTHPITMSNTEPVYYTLAFIKRL